MPLVSSVAALRESSKRSTVLFTYKVSLLNGTVMVDAAVFKKEIIIKNTVSGNYQLEIRDAHGYKKTMTITVLN